MVSGIINKMWTKNVNTKYGEKPVALFSLEGEDKVFNLGFGKQEVREGDEVSFSYDGPKYGEFQVDKSTVKIQSRDNKFEAPADTPKPAAPSGNSGNAGGKSYSRGNFPLDFTDGQRSILRQHAFTQASELFRWWHGEAPGGTTPYGVEEIIEIAYKIERYSSGDDLREDM